MQQLRERSDAPFLSTSGTMPGTLKGEGSFSCIVNRSSPSKVYTRLEISCPQPQLPGPKGKNDKAGVWGEGPGKDLQISGASSDPSGQSLSPSHLQPFEIQVIWSLQANCLGLQVLGTKGGKRKEGADEGWKPILWH